MCVCVYYVCESPRTISQQCSPFFHNSPNSSSTLPTAHRFHAPVIVARNIAVNGVIMMIIKLLLVLLLVKIHTMITLDLIKPNKLNFEY